MTMTRGWTTVQWRWRVLQLAGVLVLAAAALTIFLSRRRDRAAERQHDPQRCSSHRDLHGVDTLLERSAGQRRGAGQQPSSPHRDVNILECSAPGGVVPPTLWSVTAAPSRA